MSVKIYVDDALRRLTKLPDSSVDCVITSPPYWGLRDYGVAGQLGLETTPEKHIAALVKVFREVKRVLKPDGTLWVNYGDTYASGVNGRPAAEVVNDNRTFRDKPFSTVVGRLKPKDLVGLPWLLAFALRDRLGFYLRSDIIWHKPNCMPESAKDRPVKAHEYLFLFSKSPRYYYNYAAALEPVARETTGNQENISGLRNRRTVWTIASRGFTEAHFATFPPELVRPCLLAGCPVGGVVLDPFGGAGTVSLEAERQQKNSILIELNPAYAEIARRRIITDGGMFCQIDIIRPKVQKAGLRLFWRWLRRKLYF